MVCILLSSCGSSVVKPTEQRFYLLSGTHLETLHYEGKMKEEKNISCGIQDIKKPARKDEKYWHLILCLCIVSALAARSVISQIIILQPSASAGLHLPYHIASSFFTSHNEMHMFCIIFRLQPDNLLASVLAHPVLTASGLPGRNRRFISPSSAASAAASVLASLSSSQQPHAGRSRSHTLLPSRHQHDGLMYFSDHTVGDR